MSANLPLPKTIFGHGFLLSRGEKMSKSLGNVADPKALAETFGVDALRYFLLAEVSFGNDGSYSAEAIVHKTNTELGNAFGNLAQRTLSFIAKNLNGALPKPAPAAEDEALLAVVREATSVEMPRAFEALAPHEAIQAWLRAVYACNAYIDAQAPWALRKTDPERMEAVLATLYVAIGELAVGILPVIPTSATALLDHIGVPIEVRSYGGLGGAWYAALRSKEYVIDTPKPLFPRLEMPAEAEAQSENG
jgi:methionyl-tRNA synthetase